MPSLGTGATGGKAICPRPTAGGRFHFHSGGFEARMGCTRESRLKSARAGPSPTTRPNSAVTPSSASGDGEDRVKAPSRSRRGLSLRPDPPDRSEPTAGRDLPAPRRAPGCLRSADAGRADVPQRARAVRVRGLGAGPQPGGAGPRGGRFLFAAAERVPSSGRVERLRPHSADRPPHACTTCCGSE